MLKILYVIWRRFPPTFVIISLILPRWVDDYNTSWVVKQLNLSLRTICSDLRDANVQNVLICHSNTPFFTKKGFIRREMYNTSRLHLNDRGAVVLRQQWCKVLSKLGLNIC